MVSMIAPGTLYRNLPFVYYLAFLGVIYIALGHYAESNMRRIDRLQDELREQRWQYMSVHSDLMRMGSRSRISEIVSESGLIVPYIAPRELTINSNLPTDNQ
jgi:hypothetical protein